LERTFNLAAPLMHVDPEISIGDIKLRDYYCHHLYNALTPGHANSLPMPEDLPDATYQFTCEFGGLTKTLLLMPDVVWPYFTQQQRDEMAVTISKWAHHRTTQNNWRLFNICALSFLKKNGYAIDDDLLKSHLMWIASYHAGNGWYLEQSYNYYTISLFVVYGTIWSQTFGREHYPEIAGTTRKELRGTVSDLCELFRAQRLLSTCGQEASAIVSWISGGFPVSFLLEIETADRSRLGAAACARDRFCNSPGGKTFTRTTFPAWAFMATGNSRSRTTVVRQAPSSCFCLSSPWRCRKILPSGRRKRTTACGWIWAGSRKRTVLEKPGIVLVNHGSSGSSEIISGKVYDDDHNYSKLVFNTHFPWEDHNPKGGTSQEYSFRSGDPRDLRGADINFYLTGRTVDNRKSEHGAYTTSQSMLFNGVREWVLYRQLLMRKPPNNGVGYIIDLAEITVPGGVVRVDRCRLAFEHELTLGHFGLPHVGGKSAVVRTFESGSWRGATASIPGRQVAMIAYSGWDELESQVHRGFNAETEESTVLYAPSPTHRQEIRRWS
jgi:hypothetical protein